MAYEYETDDDVPEVPLPLINGWGFFLDMFGVQRMRGPLRLQPGIAGAPSLTFEDDNRTGIFSPEPFTVGYAIFGFLRFLVSDAGIKFLNTSGFGGTFSADGLTADRSYDLPNEDGTLALERILVTFTNASGGTLAPGTPVYQTSTASEVDKALGDDISTAYVVGLTQESILDTETGNVQTSGLLTLTTGQWDTITGETGGLTAGGVYYLSTSSAGQLTRTPTENIDVWKVVVGVAKSTTELLLNLQQPVKFASGSTTVTAGGTKTISLSATTKTGYVVAVNTTDDTCARFVVNAGSPTLLDGDPSFVAGAPGASKIGLELNGTTLRLNNGFAVSKDLAYQAFLVE